MATVEKRGKSYRITVAAGIDLNGKQIRHRFVWTPDEKLTPRQVEKELNRQVVRFEEQVKTGSTALDGNVRFVDFAERYMKDCGRLSLKPTTLSNYERNLVRINQAIGHIRLKDLTPMHIQAFYRNLQEEGIRQHTTATATPALSEWIARQPISKSAFAKKAGITHQTVSQALKGNTINQASAEKIAAATGLEVKELFTINADTTPLGPGHDPLLPPHHFLHPGEGRQMEVHPQQSSRAGRAALSGRAQGPIPGRARRQADAAAAPGRADQVTGTHHLRSALRPALAGRQPGRRRGAYRPDLQLGPAS